MFLYFEMKYIFEISLIGEYFISRLSSKYLYGGGDKIINSLLILYILRQSDMNRFVNGESGIMCKFIMLPLKN